MACNHTASGCNYPEGDCNGDCLIANVERLIRAKREKLEGETTMTTQNNLPPPPESYAITHVIGHAVDGTETEVRLRSPLYTPDQVQAYARQAIANYKAKLLEGVGEPVVTVNDHYSRDGYNDEISAFLPVDTKLYTADQAAAAVLRERTKVLEEAAKICDSTPPQPFRPSLEAAHAIRSMSK